jgi:hypothetical protein
MGLFWQCTLVTHIDWMFCWAQSEGQQSFALPLLKCRAARQALGSIPLSAPAPQLPWVVGTIGKYNFDDYRPWIPQKDDD